MNDKDILHRLRTQLTVDVPTAGKALGDLSRNPSYDAARTGKLGVEVLKVGGKLRVASAAVLRRLGLEGDEAA
jgi:hypothetical protein